MTTTQRQARNQIDGLVKKYQAMPRPDRQAITGLVGMGGLGKTELDRWLRP